ncbi:MAG: uncharacterized protein JWQ99_3472 [Blastococcus sp.]|nr:uncharacterized protein [Blastococcus sp.]
MVGRFPDEGLPDRVTSPDHPVPGPPTTDGGRLRVAAIPFTDAYVDAVLPAEAERVGPAGDPSPWLDAGHLVEHAHEIDVLHLHVGDAALSEGDLECWSESVRRLGVPLVVTVHQLRHPDLDLDARLDAHLSALLDTAEVVLTLTRGAADDISDRFGRTAIVVAHPSVAVPDPELGSERGLVGLQVGPASTAVPDPAALVRAAHSGAVSGGGRLRVLVAADNQSGLDPDIWQLAGRGAVQLVVHPREEWAAQLQQLHVAVLPERCGTHSRDLEICRDVGTRVVAPSSGWFADQWSDVVSYGDDDHGGLDEVSLSGAVAVALTRPMPRPADRTWREEQRVAVQRVHAQVYAQVAADRSWV